jgi:hypothetical protein
VSIFVQTDTPIETTCGACGGDGWEVIQNQWGPPERDACSWCDGLQLDFIDLGCFLLNLSIAGALHASFMLGWQGHRTACHVDQWWTPGAGWAAPALEAP